MARARGDLNGWWRFGLLVAGIVRWVLFGLEVSGAERVPTSGSAIVAGNHISSLDGVALALAIGQRRSRMTRFLVAAEFFGKLTVGWVLRLYRQIPLRRGEADTGALDEAITTVRRGALAGIFPEGRVNPDPGGGLQRGRTGVARIALATGAPVVPVGIWGTHRRWPRDGLRVGPPWRPKLAFAFGEPLEPRGDPSSVTDVQAFTEVVMAAIAAQVTEARRLAPG